MVLLMLSSGVDENGQAGCGCKVEWNTGTRVSADGRWGRSYTRCVAGRAAEENKGELSVAKRRRNERRRHNYGARCLSMECATEAEQGGWSWWMKDGERRRLDGQTRGEGKNMERNVRGEVLVERR